MNRKTVVLLVIFMIVIIIGVPIWLSFMQKVPAGYVGIKVYLLGGAKGVDHDVIGVGRYYIGINEDMFLFPISTQNYVWTKDKTEQSPTDESMIFQTKEGLDVNTDVGISYNIKPDKVGIVFQKYRKGVEEITSVYLRNIVRDAFIQVGAKNPVESVYGEGKTKMLMDIHEYVKKQVEEIGINVEKIYLVGSMRLPNTVIAALNAKIEATQKAQQRENELRQVEAEAKKLVVQADGEAQSTLRRAQAQAEANLLLAKSLTPELVRYESIKKWNGELPKFSGGSAIPLIDLK